MADDFIGSLKADWDREGAEASLVRLRRRRWTPHALLAADFLGAVVMAVFGLGYAALAVKHHDLLFALAAVAMLPISLPLVATGLKVRWRALAWEGETSEGVLRSSLRRLDATRRVLQLGRGGAVTLLALALAVWAAALAGWVREPRSIVTVIMASWILAGLGMLGWVQWRLGRTARERVGCELLLRQFDSASDAQA